MSIFLSTLQLIGACLFLYISILSFLGHVLPSDIAKDLGYRHGQWVRELLTKEDKK